MRKLLFKAWDEGDFCFLPLDDDADYYFRDDVDGLELYDKHGKCKDVVLLQYTGLRDKDNNRIYEGDIVKHGSKTSAVIFEGGSFALSTSTKVCLRHCDMSVFEVIGNIYENEDLLKTSQ